MPPNRQDLCFSSLCSQGWPRDTILTNGTKWNSNSSYRNKSIPNNREGHSWCHPPIPFLLGWKVDLMPGLGQPSSNQGQAENNPRSTGLELNQATEPRLTDAYLWHLVLWAAQTSSFEGTMSQVFSSLELNGFLTSGCCPGLCHWCTWLILFCQLLKYTDLTLSVAPRCRLLAELQLCPHSVPSGQHIFIRQPFSTHALARASDRGQTSQPPLPINFDVTHGGHQTIHGLWPILSRGHGTSHGLVLVFFCSEALCSDFFCLSMPCVGAVGRGGTDTTWFILRLTLFFSTLSARGQKQKSVLASLFSISNIFGHRFDKMVAFDLWTWECGFLTLFMD